MIDEHQIDADYVKGGRLTVALNGAQLRRLRHEVAHSPRMVSTSATCAS